MTPVRVVENGYPGLHATWNYDGQRQIRAFHGSSNRRQFAIPFKTLLLYPSSDLPSSLFLTWRCDQ